MNSQRFNFSLKSFLAAAFALSAGAVFLSASDWPNWRGPQRKGVSPETGLVSEWSPEGKNLIWRVDFEGRSTPVALNGRVYVAGRVGEGIDKQERLACFDADDGKLIWEHRFNVFLTTIPFPRIAWASPVGDPETGNIYFHGAQGLLTAFDRDGKIVWQRSLTEEFGRYSGYGGRTPTPIVDGDLVILNMVTGGWGNQAVPRDRFFAFDKRTGDVVWISQPGGAPADLNTYSTPVAAYIQGRRLIIGGVGDGTVYALEAETGEKVWEFQLSKRGLNASVAVEGNRVFASHSEENLDEASLGRVVAIDATGTGDVTKTHELWRLNRFAAGFASPAVHNGRLFVVDNSANLKVLDTATGKALWEHSLGTVGKASPVVADGKLYVPELNGAFHIIDVATEFKPLNTVHLKTSDGRPAEIYGSPAVAYGRVYLATEEGFYCIGDPDRRPASANRDGSGVSRDKAPPATLQIFPKELILRKSADSAWEAHLKARVFDERGYFLREVQPDWTVSGALGKVESDGRLHLQPVTEPTTGTVTGRWAELESSVRFRAFPELPWIVDFESVETGQFPGHWIGAARKFAVKETEDGKVLEKPTITRGIQRSYVFVGPPEMKGYTMQIDLEGQRQKRRLPDMGVISHRYIVALEGNYQRLSVHSWAAEKRMYQHVDYRWDPDRWYTLKVQVDMGVIRAKAWPRDEEEPAQWSIEAADPHPNLQGAPGIYGLSYADIHYDNLKITGHQQ